MQDYLQHARKYTRYCARLCAYHSKHPNVNDSMEKKMCKIRCKHAKIHCKKLLKCQFKLCNIDKHEKCNICKSDSYAKYEQNIQNIQMKMKKTQNRESENYIQNMMQQCSNIHLLMLLTRNEAQCSTQSIFLGSQSLTNNVF